MSVGYWVMCFVVWTASVVVGSVIGLKLRTRKKDKKIRSFAPATQWEVMYCDMWMASPEKRYITRVRYDCPYCEKGFSEKPTFDEETGYLAYKCYDCQGVWHTMNREQLAEAGEDILLRPVGGPLER